MHPSSLTYSKIYLRLEPLGLEMIAAAAEQAGYEAQIVDLQVETSKAALNSKTIISNS